MLTMKFCLIDFLFFFHIHVWICIICIKGFLSIETLVFYGIFHFAMFFTLTLNLKKHFFHRCKHFFALR